MNGWGVSPTAYPGHTLYIYIRGREIIALAYVNDNQIMESSVTNGMPSVLACCFFVFVGDMWRDFIWRFLCSLTLLDKLIY